MVATLYLGFFSSSTDHQGLKVFITLFEQCDLLPLRPICGEALGARFELGTGDLEAGILTTESSHIPTFKICLALNLVSI